MNPPTSLCSSCHAVIVWSISTASGKLMPVDAVPPLDGGGNVFLTERDGQWWATVLSNEAALSAGRPLTVSHFATCPNSAKHRKGKKP